MSAAAAAAAAFLDGRNTTMPVPVDITSRPPLGGTVPVETAASKAASSSKTSSAAPNGTPNDVAGVLRRNQACLACRRRKLKCDAVRPHCSTCVRSYRHLLRTAPSTNPVLSCEYDDATDKDHAAENEHTSPVDDDDDAKKKKRKASGGRRKADELDDERDKLLKRVAELEDQLQQKSASISAPPSAPAPASAPTPATSWSGLFGGGPQVDTPGAFMDLLNSTPSQNTAPGGPQPGGGFSFYRQASTAAFQWTPIGSSVDRSETMGFTPFMPMAEPDFAMEGNSPAPAMLSPNNVFNFSPAPTGPTTLNWSGTDVDMEPMSTEPQPMQPQSRQSVDNSWEPLQSILRETETSTTKQSSGDSVDTAALDEIQADKAAAFEQTLNSGGEGLLDPQLLVDLFWPGWPPNLPEPPIVNNLVEQFFDNVPNIPRILHRARFMARLQLPPTHSNFPHPALIHSICALTASWCMPEKGDREPPMHPAAWDSKAAFFARQTESPFCKKGSMTFSLRQAAFAKDTIQDGLNTGNRLFDIVRAMIILARVFIDDTRMLECWTYTGLVARMILPLGLNVRSAELSLKSVMLPPAADALEREERRIVVWMAMYHDTVASAASGWGSSMALDELSIPLPVSKEAFDAGRPDMESNPQDLESLDLYIKHPVPDPLVMTLKAAVLLNRVNKFARRWKNRRLRDNDDLDGLQRPEFRELANAIACLQMSFPPSIQDPTKVDDKRRIDVDLVSAHLTPHSAIICLYEPFADITDPNDQPARRIINAARSIINTIQRLVVLASNGAFNLGAVMHSSSSVVLVTAARTVLLFYRHALNVGDMAAAEAYRNDIECARMALGQYGVQFKIGYHHAQLIEYFLDRATNPTYDKLVAHFPEHPRPGAYPLTPHSHLGLAILTALNIKRGYWKISSTTHPIAKPNGAAEGVSVADLSPADSSPASVPGLTHRTSASSDSPASGQLNMHPSAWGNELNAAQTAAALSSISSVKYFEFSGSKDQQPMRTPSSAGPSPPSSIPKTSSIPPELQKQFDHSHETEAGGHVCGVAFS